MNFSESASALERKSPGALSAPRKQSSINLFGLRMRRAREQKDASAGVWRALRGGLFCESVTSRFARFAAVDAPSARRFHPPVHNFFARVNRRPVSAPASSGTAEFSACARVKRAQVFFVSMLEVSISSAFLASGTEKRANSQNCRTIARRAMPANAGGGR